METSIISSKFQVVIPKKIREQFKIKPGQQVVFIPYKNSLRIVLVPLIEDAHGMLKGMSVEGFREEMDEER